MHLSRANVCHLTQISTSSTSQESSRRPQKSRAIILAILARPRGVHLIISSCALLNPVSQRIGVHRGKCTECEIFLVRTSTSESALSIVAVGFCESIFIEVPSPNSSFTLMVAILKSYNETNFTELDSMRVSIKESYRGEGETHCLCRKFSTRPPLLLHAST